MLTGTVIWYDESSGEGTVEVDGESVYLNYLCFEGQSYTEIPSVKLKAGQLLSVTIYENLYSKRIETARIAT